MLPAVTVAAFGASSTLVGVLSSLQRCYAVPRDRRVSGGSTLQTDRQPDSVGPLCTPLGCPAEWRLPSPPIRPREPMFGPAERSPVTIGEWPDCFYRSVAAFGREVASPLRAARAAASVR